jgi:plastocyanin
MNGTLFYIFGITLVVSALVVSLVGLRFETFPPSRGALAGVVIYFAVLVGATTTFAVLHAADDQHARQAAEAQAATPAGGAGTTAASSTTTSTASTTSAPAAAALKLSAPSSGTPAYNTDKLSAKTGQVTIDFSNPSPVQHDVAIAQGSKVIAQSDLISGGSTSVSSSLKPGKYLYYCTVPGHRQAGMQGTLTVK